jgi:sarcosine oxidase subunit beta
MEPQLDTTGVGFGAFEPHGGYADPAMVANSFAAAAEREGVQIMRSTEVVDIRVEKGAVSAVVTSKGEIPTRSVVNIAGPWGNQIAKMVGAQLPLSASRHPVLVLERPETWHSPTPVWGDLVQGWYFKPEGRHGIMIGSLTEVESDRNVDAEKYTMKTSYEETVPYSEAILNRFPVMGDGSATGGWAGLYDVTPDGLPIIDEFPESEGFFCAVGWNGHGFKTSPALGVLMAELVATRKCTKYDISIFRRDRFATQTGLATKSAYAIIG